MIRFPFSKPRDPNAEPAEGAPNEAQDAVQDEAAGAQPQEETLQDDAWLAEEQQDEATPSEQALQAAPYGERLVEQAEEEAAERAETLDVGTLENPTPGAEATDGFNRPDLDEQVRMVEAMLFASDKPLSTAELASRMPIGCDAAVAVRRLEEHYAGRGVHLVRVAGKWAFRTAPDLAHLLSDESVEQRKLSRAGIETLAIIAYHQPVTRAEIEEIRQVGVSKGTIDLLMELEWIKLGRRRQTPGRPVTFVTTDKFLEHFGLENVKDLPRLEELRQAGLLDSRPPVGYTPGAGEGFEDDDVEDEEEDDEDDDAYGDEDQQDLLM